MATTRTKGSERFLPRPTCIDVLGASPKLRQRVIHMGFPTLTQNVITYNSVSIPATFKVISIYIVFPVIPVVSGGTSTYAIDRYATDGSTKTNIVAAATDCLSGFTAFIPVLQTLAATNPTSTAVGQSIVITLTTSNNSVTTNHIGGSVTLLVEPIEDAIISDSDTTV